MTYQGLGDTSVNNTLTRVIPSLLHRGEHPNDVLERVVGAVMEMAARCGLNWDRGAEVKATRGRILSAYNNLLLKDYDQATSEIPVWLPGEFHVRWSAVLAEGCSPCFGFNRGGFYVRNPQRAKQRGPEVEPAAYPAPTAKAPVSDEPPPKKYRFPMLRFNEMQLGTEANYIVDELIPTAGLVLVYGAPKSGKSFWAFDLTLHVALGWEYRERAVQQGTVIYCAFEGAHGYRKRKEAFRMHHMLTDEDPPLYVVPGRADLIKEHTALIRELREQITRDKPPARRAPSGPLSSTRSTRASSGPKARTWTWPITSPRRRPSRKPSAASSSSSTITESTRAGRAATPRCAALWTRKSRSSATSRTSSSPRSRTCATAPRARRY